MIFIIKKLIEIEYQCTSKSNYPDIQWNCLLSSLAEMHGQWQTGRDRLRTVMSQVWVTSCDMWQWHTWIWKKCDKVVTVTSLSRKNRDKLVTVTLQNFETCDKLVSWQNSDITVRPSLIIDRILGRNFSLFYQALVIFIV